MVISSVQQHSRFVIRQYSSCRHVHSMFVIRRRRKLLHVSYRQAANDTYIWKPAVNYVCKVHLRWLTSAVKVFVRCSSRSRAHFYMLFAITGVQLRRQVGYDRCTDEGWWLVDDLNFRWSMLNTRRQHVASYNRRLRVCSFYKQNDYVAFQCHGFVEVRCTAKFHS